MSDRLGRILLAFSAGAIVAAGWWIWVQPLSLLILGAIALALLLTRSTRLWAALPLGMLWFAGHAWLVQESAWPADRSGETLTFEARVVGLPDQTGRGVRAEFSVDSAGRHQGLPERVLLSWFWAEAWFRPGERWRLTARIEPPSGSANPGLFDYHRYLVARGLGAQGQILQAERLEAAAGLQTANRFRQRFADWIQAETASLDAAALHRALTVADRSAMGPDLATQLRRTGTAHLLSISGLHVGMVAGLAGGFAALLLMPWPGLPDRRRPALIVGLIAAFGYAALAGFSLPTQRALIMLAVGFGALLMRRPLAPGRALVVALAAVLLVAPLSPLDVGFWLSFGAVAVLIWTFAGRRRSAGFLRGLLIAQLAVAIGLLPLNLGVFQQWAPMAWAANLLAIPLVGFWILPVLLIALLLFALGLHASVLVSVAETGSRLLLTVLDAVYRMDLGVAGIGLPTLPAPGLAALLLAALGALWLLAPRGWPLRALGLVLLVPLMWPPRVALAPGEFEIRMPDLGGGLAVMVLTARHTVLYGTGPGDGDRFSRVESVLAPLLRQSGRRSPDRVIVPGPARTMAGGASGVRRAWPDARIQTAAADDPDRCREGRVWILDGVRFRTLHPSAALPDLGADSGCVLEVRSDHGAVLLPGDIGRDVWRRLIQRDQLSPVSALVVPRGGHPDALIEGAIQRLRPAYALIAADHRRGRPDPGLRAQLEADGTEVLTTGDCGALHLRFAEKGIEVQAERRVNRRFWADGEDCGG